MTPRRPLVVGALALAVLAAGMAVWLVVTGAPATGLLVPAGLLILALVGGALALRPERAPAFRRRGPHLEPERLRPGRLRDYTVRAIGYQRQFQALAETFPHPPTRAALAHDLPAVEAAVRAVHDLCLAVQAYELGESQPPALVRIGRAERARLAAAAEAALDETLTLLGQTYAQLRGAWSAPPAGSVPVAAPLADLPALTSRLRELAATFAPTAPLQPLSS